MNCPSVKAFMAETNISGKCIDVGTPCGMNLAREQEIMSLPTVNLFDSNGNLILRSSKLSEIKEFIFSREKEHVAVC